MAPRRGWIDKKNATTYQLFHRSQNDPLIHDPSADDRVLHQISGPAPSCSSSPSAKGPGRTLSDLESEFDPTEIRKNEGEAANYGIYYDDTEYDYMQHMRDLGKGEGEAHFVDSIPVTVKGKKGKGKVMRLEDALKETSLEDEEQSQFGGSSVAGSSQWGGGLSTASTYSRKPTYQDQQDVPDAIAGFKPNMDPRLREVLEALEDDAYVAGEDDDDDVFGSLVNGNNGFELESEEWEDTLFEDEAEDDGWDSDVTEKALQPNGGDSSHPTIPTSDIPQKPQDSNDNAANPTPADTTTATATTTTTLPPDGSASEIPPPTTAEDNDWLHEFAKFKKASAAGTHKPVNNNNDTASNAAPARSIQTTTTQFTANGTPIRKKKRKGALTNPSAYSMTSSSLARTDGLRLLDDRFEKVEALYSVDEDEDEEGYNDTASLVSGMSKMSKMSTASSSAAAYSVTDDDGNNVGLRSDFNSVMDDFLGGWGDASASKRKGAVKGKLGKHGNEKNGMRMLDEVRKGLGPARVKGGKLGGAS